MNKKIMGLTILTIFFLVLAVNALAVNGAEYGTGWVVTVSEDEMTGEKSWYAQSPYVYPTKSMDFPYRDVKARLCIGYDGEDEWVYIWFSQSPNLIDTEIGDGYNIISTRIKWDDKIENVYLTQEWGSKFIHFNKDEEVVSKIIKSNTMMLELNWYGQGKVYFQFPLEGADEAIDEIHNKF